jgi:hypothetical protein
MFEDHVVRKYINAMPCPMKSVDVFERYFNTVYQLISFDMVLPSDLKRYLPDKDQLRGTDDKMAMIWSYLMLNRSEISGLESYAWCQRELMPYVCENDRLVFTPRVFDQLVTIQGGSDSMAMVSAYDLDLPQSEDDAFYQEMVDILNGGECLDLSLSTDSLSDDSQSGPPMLSWADLVEEEEIRNPDYFQLTEHLYDAHRATTAVTSTSTRRRRRPKLPCSRRIQRAFRHTFFTTEFFDTITLVGEMAPSSVPALASIKTLRVIYVEASFDTMMEVRRRVLQCNMDKVEVRFLQLNCFPPHTDFTIFERCDLEDNRCHYRHLIGSSLITTFHMDTAPRYLDTTNATPCMRRIRCIPGLAEKFDIEAVRDSSCKLHFILRQY